jgi:hypothetical protein
MKKIQRAIADREFFNGMETRAMGAKVRCHYSGGKGPQTLFWGDSNMQQYAPRITKLMLGNKGEDRGSIFITRGGKPPIPGITMGDMINCFRHVLYEDKRIDRVVIAAWWHGYFTKETLYSFNGTSFADPSIKKKGIDSMALEIHRLVSMGKRVTLVMSTPTGWGFDPKDSLRRGFTGFQLRNTEKVKKEDFLHEYGEMPIRIAEAAKANGAEVIDPLDYLCTNGVCIAEDEKGIPIRYDATHLRPGYVREHVKYLDQTVAP